MRSWWRREKRSEQTENLLPSAALGQGEGIRGQVSVKPAVPHSYLGMATRAWSPAETEWLGFPNCHGLDLKCPSLSHVLEVLSQGPVFRGGATGSPELCPPLWINPLMDS